MSGWYVLLERELPGSGSPPESGKALLYFHHQIDELAERLELPALSGFFCPERSEILAYLRDQGVTRDEDGLPDEEWFEAADGLVTVRGLLARLRLDPSGVPQAQKIIADLEVVERALVAAKAHGIRFHLSRKLPTGQRPEA